MDTTQSAFSTLRVTLDAHVARVELNRPEKANAMELAMWEELRAAMQWLDATPEDEAIRRMQENRVPVAPVLNTSEAVAHPHLRERGTVRKAHDPVLGEVDVPGFPIRFSAAPEPLGAQAPLLGQHNAEVLKELLGYSDERIAQLKEQGVLIESAIDLPRVQAKVKQA